MLDEGSHQVKIYDASDEEIIAFAKKTACNRFFRRGSKNRPFGKNQSR